jgi:hypothetical protein
MILLGQRRAKDRHDAIACHVLDGSPVAMHFGPDQLVQVPHAVVQRVESQAFACCRGGDQRAAENGHHLLFPREGSRSCRGLVGFLGQRRYVRFCRAARGCLRAYRNLYCEAIAVTAKRLDDALCTPTVTHDPPYGLNDALQRRITDVLV